MGDAENVADDQHQRLAPTEDWIFGDDPRAMQGYLRSLDSTRDEKIANKDGIRVYPPSKRGSLPFIIWAEQGTCSGDYCKPIHGPCQHTWEDRFRFGSYAGRRFVPPSNRVQIGAKRKGKYVGVSRHRPRPNPMVDGVKHSTLMRHARIDMPSEYKNLLHDVLKQIRAEDEKKPIKRGRGRPPIDLYDAVMVSVVRFAKKLSYEQLDNEICELYNGGYITTTFKFPRVVEVMNDRAFGALLDRIVVRLMRPFRNVCEVLGADGMVFSTARTDNARTNRLSVEGPLQMTLHALYDLRWGFLAAFRLTWFQRGRGSGEAPQFPYLATRALEVLKFDLITADTAYCSRRNYSFAAENDFDLDSKPKKNAKAPTQNDSANLGKAINDPRLLQRFPFRNRVEGWNDVFRETTESYIVSRPDRSNYPKQTKIEKRAAEMMKEQPELAEVDLPEDQEEREKIIETEQFVGVSPNNEMRCRQIYSFLRALVKAQMYYNDRVDFKRDRAFQPRAEDEAFSIYRPLPGQVVVPDAT